MPDTLSSVVVDFWGMWAGGTPPAWLAERQPPMELSAEELLGLHLSYDVALVHSPRAQPSRRERGRGAAAVAPAVGLYLDVKGGRFKTR